jgi:hypothetical protein
MSDIVTLCGSTRFKDRFEEVAAKLTLEGHIVLMPNVWVRSVPAYADLHDTAAKDRLDALHREKIRLSSRVVVVSPGGYVGESTSGEIEYAHALGLPITYVE